ncbi:FHA domain-containing protein, partial [Streptomyces toxytricini]|uniref:FHA domain-containing protein n=1 Tax=Streptomyces toxytricini TaxID=67369 RepID=UPI0034284050
PLSAVASGLAATVGGPDTGGTAALYAGERRLDPQRHVLGEPPLVDGAVLGLHGPVPDTAPDAAEGAQLHVVAGPDAGGVHLLHPGMIRIGRSADADVPLDDPDVSRLHCTVTVLPDGRVAVADLDSTNGTTLDGAEVGRRPVPLAPGALLRIGESTLRLVEGAAPPLPVVPDLEGHLRPAGPAPAAGPAGPAPAGHHPAAPAQPAAPPVPAATAAPPAAPPAAGPAPAAPGGAAGPRRPLGGLGAWARKWVRGEEEPAEHAPAGPPAPAVPDADDPATLLLAALGPTARLWSRPPGRLDVGLGAGSRVALQDCGSLALAGPRARLAGVARSLVAQLAALHAPAQLEIVLISADRARTVAQRREEWGWLGWLPHVRPAHGQDCRLLLAYDRDQAAARTGELTRRLDAGPLGADWAAADPSRVREAAAAHTGPRTLLVVDGDPGTAALRDLTGRLASHGPAAGIHVLVLAETPAATPASPLAETYEAACAAAPAFRDCGAAALLSGDVATAVRTFAVAGGRPCPPGTTATADAVSAAWAERFARALAPLKAEPAGGKPQRPAAAALPAAARLLDELGLARATPASLMARWAEATEQGQGVGGLVELVLGSGQAGPVGAELVQDGPHLLVTGPAGSGRTELLRSVAASLAAAARPDRLGLVLVDGAGGERGDGLAPAAELPHASAHLVASDPVRMREFAQALGAELKRRAELLEGVPFAEWHARRQVSDRMVAPRRPAPGEQLGGDPDQPRTGTLRLRASAVRTGPVPGPGPLPRLVVLVDDYDALVAPALGSAGRPAAGSVVRALETVARDGAALGVHLMSLPAFAVGCALPGGGCPGVSTAAGFRLWLG